jgi:6-pyruvoyltetrahydropterin/6-carboxytetrahydropterin synthase
MYKIKVISHFSSAHTLRGYKGKCESLHGHNWKVEALVKTSKLNHLGMVVDFSELKKILNQILDQFDHQNLNDLDIFKKNNPSSEQIAKCIFNQLQKKISKKNCYLEEVRVWETDSSCASYSKE